MKSLIPWWEYSFRMCHRIGRPPISTIGLGRTVVSSLSRVPNPPARITAFIDSPDCCDYCTIKFQSDHVASFTDHSQQQSPSELLLFRRFEICREFVLTIS